jgi:streptogramin lyase
VPEVPATSAPEVTSPPTSELPDGVRELDITSGSHGVHLFSIAAGQGALWVPDEMGPWMYRVDPGSGKVTDITLEEGSRFEDVSDARAIVAMGSVWVADGLPQGHVYRVDPNTGKVLYTFTVVTPLALSAGFGSIWVSSFEWNDVMRIDPSTNDVVAHIDATGPLSLVPAFGGMWVLEHRANTVGLIDPDKNKIVKRISFNAQFPERMAASMGSLWVSSPVGDEVLRFDPIAGELITRVAVGGHPYELADGPGGLWISSEDGLYRIGKGSELAGPIPLDGHVTGVAIHNGQVWTTRVDGTKLFAVDPSSLSA